MTDWWRENPVGCIGVAVGLRDGWSCGDGFKVRARPTLDLVVHEASRHLQLSRGGADFLAGHAQPVEGVLNVGQAVLPAHQPFGTDEGMQVIIADSRLLLGVVFGRVFNVKRYPSRRMNSEPCCLA